MLTGETGKQRSRRIPLDYHRRSDRIGRLRGILSVSLSVATLLWVCGLGPDVRRWSRMGEVSRQRASHGPLARPHANWETACDECHVPFQPIDGSTWMASLASNPRAGDAKCAACHAGPKHSASEIDAEVTSCASCHRDHQGRNNSLLAMADAQCTRCHADLGPHMRPGAIMTVAASISKFEDDPGSHPEFALFLPGKSEDPGTIRFNHQLHMTPGLNSERTGKPLMTPTDLAEADQPKYTAQGTSAGDPIRLNCDSCHQPDGERRGRPIEGGQGGARMKPISFERDCRACHLLSYDPDLPPVRHGLQPAEVSESLWQAYSGQHVKKQRKGDARAEPGRSPVPGIVEDPENPELHDVIRQEVARAERVLFGQKRCGECHSIEKGPPSTGLAKRNDDRGLSLTIPPSAIPRVWFRRASFDHGAHRAGQCRDCHAGAFPDASAASKTNADVLIPSISNCLQCHSPRPTNANASGAGHSCTQCHPYHNGESPVRGGPMHEPPPDLLAGRTPSRAAPAIPAADRRLIADVLGRPSANRNPGR